MGFFRTAHGQRETRRGWKKGALSLKFITQMMKLAVIPYPKKTQKIYKLRNETLEFCLHQHFFTGNQQFLLYQKYRYRSNFNT